MTTRPGPGRDGGRKPRLQKRGRLCAALFTGQTGWSALDTAPLNEDVMLVVTDGSGDPYTLPHPCRRTAAGWVSSNKGTPLVVTPIKWKQYIPSREKR
jgi:hypothetical protein